MGQSRVAGINLGDGPAGSTPGMPRQKTINIIGRGRGRGHGLAASGERWSCNYHTPGVDVMFYMHRSDIDADRQAESRAKTAEAGIRIIDLESYPIDEIQDHFKTKFFGNTICYMIAYALYQGYERIVLWGCNIKPGPADEPIVKNHYGVEFWIGYAMGMGVDIQVQGDSYILTLKHGMYGYDWPVEPVIAAAENAQGAPY